MVIGVTGYGYTGASACMDLLKEFKDMQFYDPHIEFQLLQQPDGVADLRYALINNRGRITVNTAIKRFIRRYNYKRSDLLSARTGGKYVRFSKEYIDSLITVSWEGKSKYDPEDLLTAIDSPKLRLFNGAAKRASKLVNKNSVWPPFKTRYYSSVTEEEFISRTRDYLNKIFRASGFDLKKPIMLEQLFRLENPTEGGDYFDESRAIIVDRDPRDVFVLTNKAYPRMSAGFMPNDGSVETFVNYYRSLHSSIVDDPSVYYLRYEDLIYRYDETVSKIKSFVGLEHASPKSRFKPEWSINNTQVFKKYPELSDKIKYIEANLSEYLYPFDEASESISFVPEDVGIFDNVPGDKIIEASKAK